MEIPNIYRETGVRVSFTGLMKVDEKTGNVYFKYPGGEVPALNVSDLVNRLERKSFNEKEIEKIVVLFLETVATEASVSVAEVLENVN